MATLERETEISGRRLAAWRAGLPTLVSNRVVLRELRRLDAEQLRAMAGGLDGEWPPVVRERQP